MRRLPIKRSKLLTAPLLPNSPNAAQFARAMYRLAYSTYLAQFMHARIGYMQTITTSFERKKYIDVKICDRVPNVGVRGRFPCRRKQEAVIA